MMKYTIDGVPLTVGKRDDVIRECIALIGVGGKVFTVNSLMLERAHRNPEFSEILSLADINTVDGVGVRAALRILGERTDTLAGVELGEIIAERGNPSIALIGGRDGVAEAAFSYLKEKNPRLRRSFVLSGFGYSDEYYLEKLRRHRPKLCYVCLGSPRQESFVTRAALASPSTLFFALGGSLDIYSGEKPRSPYFMRALGLEWLYRMIKEPKRRENLSTLISFSIRSLMRK